MTAAITTNSPIMPGQEIGNYKVIEEIGRGAMGSVYHVRSRNIPRKFALKLIAIPGGPEGKGSMERVKAEVMALAKFHHPHIVGLIDAFSVPDRRIAIVMDYVQGKPLDLMRDELTVPQFMMVFRQIASALHAIHAQDVVHRDIKPSNILISWEISEMEPHAYLIDFGITSGVKKAHQLTNGFIGSPAFASPEQVAGGDVTVATDLFSLGAVGFDAITGVAPFEADTVVASLQKHLRWKRPDLTPFHNVEFPAGFCELVSAMLEPDPADRPSSLRQVVGCVDDLLGLSDVFEGSEAISEARASQTTPHSSQVTIASDGSDSVSEVTVEVASDGGDRIWIDDGVVYLKREFDRDPQIVDTGGLTATGATLVPDGLAFAVERGEVHILSQAGARKVVRVVKPVLRLHWSPEDERLVITTAEFQRHVDI